MIFSLFILPAVLMFAIYGLMGSLISNVESDVSAHVSQICIVNAPEGFESAMSSSGFESNTGYTDESDTSGIDGIKDQILEGTFDLLVVFDKDYLAKVKAYSKSGDPIPDITIFFNNTADYSQAAYRSFVSMVLEPYETGLLEARIGNLESLTVSNVKSELIQKEAKAKGQFLSMMLPYLLVMLLFASAMSIVVDAIAGEKERGTMASMLLTPVKRQEIVAGKLLSLSIIASLSALVYAASLLLALPLMGSQVAGAAGGGVSFSPLQVIQLALMLIILIYLFVALISLVSILAKSTKEAQTYVSPMYILVILAGIMTMFTTQGDKATGFYAIPVYGNALAIKDLLVGELQTANYLASLGGILVLAIIITAGITKAFNSEKVMFNA